MKEKIFEFIERIKSNNKIANFDEVSTKQAIILPVLQAVGWNTFDIDEVSPEYSVENKRVDYALRLNHTVEYFIEVKKPSEDLDKHQEQLLNYSFRQGVELAILTNGITWWFYLPTQKGTWRDRKFYTIDLLQQETEDIYEKIIDLLSKNNVLNGTALENALLIFKSKQKNRVITQTIPEAWNRIISEPDPILLELVSDVVERLCGYKPSVNKIESFVKMNREQFIVFPNIEIKTSNKNKTSNTEKTNSKKATPNEKISQDDLIPYLVMVLYDYGGKATKSQVEDKIYNIFEEQFSDDWYHEKVSHGVERWRHNVAWAKEKAIQLHDLIKPASESGRGIWELTNKGKDYYYKIKSDINKK